MCRDQCTKQMHAFEQSKASLAKIESDIATVCKLRMVSIKEAEHVGRKLEKHDC